MMDYQPLFDLLHNEHGLILLESEMGEIMRCVEGMQAKPVEGFGDCVKCGEPCFGDNWHCDGCKNPTVEQENAEDAGCSECGADFGEPCAIGCPNNDSSFNDLMTKGYV